MSNDFSDIEPSVDMKRLKRALKHAPRPAVMLPVIQCRMSDLEAMFGISQPQLQPYVNEYERTGGKSGLRSFKIKGRDGALGGRYFLVEDVRAFIPTIMRDAAEAAANRIA